jgi:hypothetical protein
MQIPLAQFGVIHDKTTGQTLDAAALERAVADRARLLASLGSAPGSKIAITHGGTAAFFVD